METLETYRQIIERILTEQATIPYAYGNIQFQTVFDHASDHYLLMLVGREGVKRVHGCLIRDGTEHGIARDLIEAGVPKDHIVLAFHSMEARKHTEFAVA